MKTESCPYCGCDNLPSARFCMECHGELAEVTHAPATQTSQIPAAQAPMPARVVEEPEVALEDARDAQQPPSAPAEATGGPPVYCKNCGSELLGYGAFCDQCAAPVERSVVSDAAGGVEGPAEAGAAHESESIETAKPAANICPECWVQTSAGALYCANCGTMLTVDTTPEVDDPSAMLKASQEAAKRGWEFEVCLPTGETQTFDSADALREDILRGTVPKSAKARSAKAGKDGKKTESEWSTVEKVSVRNEKLRSLYRPVWSYTMKFLMYGIVAGIILKGIDTVVLFFRVNALAGFLLLAVWAALLASGKWRGSSVVLVIAIIASIRFGIGTNLFMVVLGAMFIGSIFGAPAGMLVGTIVGLFRRGKGEVAPDAGPEGGRPLLLGIVVPLSVLAIIVPLYIWFNMKLPEWLG
jgi:hypothetical protein